MRSSELVRAWQPVRAWARANLKADGAQGLASEQPLMVAPAQMNARVEPGARVMKVRSRHVRS